VRRNPKITIAESSEVYRPSDDTFLLLEAISVEPGERFLEVGTETGIIALHAAALTGASATDANPEAVKLARSNALVNHLALFVVRCDLLGAVRGPFDIVALNPPYLAGRPTDELERAWHGGASGNEIAVRFLAELPRVLAPGGRAYLLLSRHNTEARKFAESHFETKKVGSKTLFFETLEVVRLRQRLE